MPNQEKPNSLQAHVLQTIADIQDEVVQIALCRYKPGDALENILYNVTGELICCLMEQLDDFSDRPAKVALIDQKTGKSVKEKPFLMMHDVICDYLKFENL